MRATLRGYPVVAAPGKLFLTGEYAVLYGGTAVVAAVNRYAVGQFIDGLDDASPVIAEAVRATKAALGDRAAALPAGSVLVDSDDLSGDGGKLGLGSSAAAAAVAVGALLEVAGVSIAQERDRLFSLAEAAHRAAQGGVGSGGDVAAVVHGGVIAYTRPPGGIPVIRRLPSPEGVELVVFSAGLPSATVERVRGVAALAQTAPEQHADLVGALGRASAQFVEAFGCGDRGGLFAAVRASFQGLTALGEAAGLSIVTPPVEAAAQLAQQLGGAAKPSGAGGGDVGVAFFPDRETAGRFAARAAEMNIRVLDLRIESAGTHRRTPGTG